MRFSNIKFKTRLQELHLLNTDNIYQIKSNSNLIHNSVLYLLIFLYAILISSGLGRFQIKQGHH